MAESTPTKEGQNLIIKNLSSIFMTLVGLSIAALFAWAQKVSNDSNANKVIIQSLQDEITRLEAKLNGTNTGLKNDIQDVRNDIDQLQTDGEKIHDDLKIRTTRVEDWQTYWQLYHPIKK